MNSILSNPSIEEREAFWGRQTRATHTAGQLAFDVVFGILMPLFCFYSDPGIIRGTGSTMLGEFSIFIYGFSGIAILTLSTWVVFGHRLRSSTPIFGGVFLAGATVSLAIAVMILPLTLIGLVFLIGVLGFVPFITGFVYLRNGLRAIGRASQAALGRLRVTTVVFSAVIALALPGLAQWVAIEVADQSIARIMDENSGPIDEPIARIKRLHLVIDTNRIVREYEKETATARKERLARAYKEITGEEIELRLRNLND